MKTLDIGKLRIDIQGLMSHTIPMSKEDTIEVRNKKISGLMTDLGKINTKLSLLVEDKEDYS